MLSGFELPIDRLAFSQPTAQGRALAESYTGTARFLVYAERPAHQEQVGGELTPPQAARWGPCRSVSPWVRTRMVMGWRTGRTRM